MIIVLDVTVIIGVEVNVDVLSVYGGDVNGDIVVGFIVVGVGVEDGDKILDGDVVVALVFVTSYTAKPATAAPINPKAIFLSMR
ncbi:MAG: hypothetical protein QXF46_09605 [Thermofilaceae archaeon]